MTSDQAGTCRRHRNQGKAHPAALYRTSDSFQPWFERRASNERIVELITGLYNFAARIELAEGGEHLICDRGDFFVALLEPGLEDYGENGER